jgi:hypothetical protein
MGIFDKAESEAEDMAQKDPNLAQQAQQFGGGQGGQDDMQTAQNTVGQQGGPQDSRDQNMGGQGMDSDQGMDPSQQMGNQDMGGQGMGGQDMGNQDPNQQMGNQDQNMGNQDPNMQTGDQDQNMDQNQGQNQNW